MATRKRSVRQKGERQQVPQVSVRAKAARVEDDGNQVVTVRVRRGEIVIRIHESAFERTLIGRTPLGSPMARSFGALTADAVESGVSTITVMIEGDDLAARAAQLEDAQGNIVDFPISQATGEGSLQASSGKYAVAWEVEGPEGTPFTVTILQDGTEIDKRVRTMPGSQEASGRKSFTIS